MNDSLNLAVNKLLRVVNAHRGRELTPALREALNEFVLLEGPDASEKTARICGMLADVTSASGAGILATWLGAGVERGADPSPQVRPLLDCFLRFARQVKPSELDSEEDLDDDLSVGLELLGQGLVAHLSRDEQCLRIVRVDLEAVAELERVEAYSVGPMWVLELIRKVSGSLIVLHGTQPIGARVEYRNISNCFHLFTLLQAALVKTMPDAGKLSQQALAVARGESLEPCSDQAWWHYGQPLSGTPDLSTMVYGEQSPQDIGSIDGQQVLLIWPQTLKSRSWDAGFFGPVLLAAPAEVKLIEPLTAAEVAKWRLRIGLPSSKITSKNPWWMPWRKSE
ncbi:MAG: hypothetical protein RL095_3136 [Verrucomicrobiota bacterium]|jgi:hypothetical protein